jgi:hypothetical protein
MLLEFLKQIDSKLQPVFNDNSLDDSDWFLKLESIISKEKPNSLKHIENYELVKYYTQLKFTEKLNEQSNRSR